jgi:hypothetical protein
VKAFSVPPQDRPWIGYERTIGYRHMSVPISWHLDRNFRLLYGRQVYPPRIVAFC